MFVRKAQTELDPRPVQVGNLQPFAKASRVAILLNANAKRVNSRVRRTLSHVIPESDLFLTKSFEEAREVAELVVDRRYQTVFTGGGDGTFCGFANEIFDAIDRRRSSNPRIAIRPPRFGVLKLGTGNALASVCGASSSDDDGLIDDILRARANEIPGVRRLEMIVAEGKRALFAGLGVDAGILNHYVEIKHAASRSPFSRMLAGGAGYAIAIAGRSVPSYLFSSKPNIEIRNRSAAYKIGPDGKPVGPAFGPGAILYSGPALLAAASTVPCYGFNFKFFPFAGSRRGMMHLRVADLAIPKVIPNIYPKLWEGRWFPEGIHDFLVEDVEIRADKKVPFQISGDAEGYRDFVRLSTWKSSIELIDFSAERKA